MHENQPMSYAHDPQSEYLYDDAEKIKMLRKRVISWIPEWHGRSACRSSNIDSFFGRENENGKGTITLIELRKAKRVCAKCDVFGTCLKFALDSRERFGVWGGTSGRTRMRILGMIDHGEVTLEEVLADYSRGDTIKYENPWGMDIADEEEVDA